MPKKKKQNLTGGEGYVTVQNYQEVLFYGYRRPIEQNNAISLAVAGTVTVNYNKW
ncbi:MAG: hypothetical protein ACE5NM_12645 [Sedimentisphaerales bacterium]